MKFFNQHQHTSYSHDSNTTPKEYIEYYMNLGIENIVFTDHYDLDLDMRGDNMIFDIDKRDEELNSLKQEYKNIHIMSGIEIGYEKRLFNQYLEELNNHDFDLVIMSVHFLNGLDYYKAEILKNKDINQVMNNYFDSMLDGVTNFPRYDILGHIDYGFRTALKVDQNQKIQNYGDKLVEIFKALIKRDKVLEINTKVQERIGDDNHTKYLLDLYKKSGGINITLTSDGHSVERAFSSFNKYMKMIKEAGFDHLNYFIDGKRYNYYL